jgi:hypothetical protein
MENNIVKDFFWIINLSLRQALRIDILRFLICYIRFLFFFYIKRNFRTLYELNYKSESIPGNKKLNLDTIEYNANYTKFTTIKELFNQFSGYRSQRLVGILQGVFSGVECLRHKKCLSIGPRTESELFSLASYGAKIKDIKGLDLQTYSPLIEPGDVTNIPFGDNSFDCIVAGWIVHYVSNQEKAVSELIRVLKPNGYLALSVSWYPEGHKYDNGDFSGGRNIKNSEALLKLFQGYQYDVIFNYDQSKIDPNQVGDIILLLRVNKWL